MGSKSNEYGLGQTYFEEILTETNLLKVWTIPHIFRWELYKTFPKTKFGKFFEIINLIKNSNLKQGESDTERD